MKYLMFLFLGIFIGVGGEFLIPKQLRTTVGQTCMKQVGDNKVYMPELYIYDPKNDPYPIPLGGKALIFMPSYRYAYALLTKEVVILSKDECNAVVEKLLESRIKK